MPGEYPSRLCAIERFGGHKQQADLRVRWYGQGNGADSERDALLWMEAVSELDADEPR